MSIQTSRVVHLNRYYHFTELMRDPAIAAELLRYQSEHDGTLQTTLVLRPTARPADKLFFFFHGMDGDSGDGVVVRNLVKDLNATVVAMGGRGPAWVSDGFLADAEQVIRAYSKGSQGFYLIGVSMGGTQALSLAGLLPDDLRRRVLGVVALIPGVNLPAILARSANDRVRNTLRASANDDATVLHERSPTNVSAAYQRELPFVIFYNHEDTLLLTDELKTFVGNLRRQRHKVTTFSAPGDHNFTYEDFDFAEAISRLGSDATENGPPLVGAGQ